METVIRHSTAVVLWLYFDHHCMASSLDLDNAQHFPSVVFSCIVNVFSGHVHVVLAKLCVNHLTTGRLVRKVLITMLVVLKPYKSKDADNS